MKIENRDAMNQVIGMLYAIECVADEDGICAVANKAKNTLIDVLENDGEQEKEEKKDG